MKTLTTSELKTIFADKSAWATDVEIAKALLTARDASTGKYYVNMCQGTVRIHSAIHEIVFTFNFYATGSGSTLKQCYNYTLAGNFDDMETTGVKLVADDGTRLSARLAVLNLETIINSGDWRKIVRSSLPTITTI